MRTLPRGNAATPAAAAAPAGPAQPGHSTAPIAGTGRPAGRILDSAVAKAVMAAWNGDPAIVVKSPPGSGKTRMVSLVAADLAARARLSVAIATQTRAQAVDVASRIAALGGKVTLLGKKGSTAPVGLHPDAHYAPGRDSTTIRDRIVVATTARWQWTPVGWYSADLLIVEEAFQLTYADLCTLGTLADQVLMVGDPGQIEPIVVGSTRRWRTWATGPHLPAPVALSAAHPDSVTHLQLPDTWRLGPDTTRLVQPIFYPDLPFGSRRPPSSLHDTSSTLPEISTLDVAGTTGRDDPAIVAAAVCRVRQLLADTHLTTPDGTRRLAAADVALIVPHVEQASAAAAQLADTPGVLVGTINQVQGAERHAVVAVHPLAGYRRTTAAATNSGRLCVALSRHRAHLTLVTDPGVDALLSRAQRTDPTDAGIVAHRAVLEHLQKESPP